MEAVKQTGRLLRRNTTGCCVGAVRL